MEDLIKALNIIWPYLKDHDTEWPTGCGHEILYVCRVDFDKIPVEDIHTLYRLGFIPGSDEDLDISIYNEDGEYEGDVDFETISQEDWDNIKVNLTDCFHSYRFGSC